MALVQDLPPNRIYEFFLFGVGEIKFRQKSMMNKNLNGMSANRVNKFSWAFFKNFL